MQIKFYDVFREATQASNNELGLLMTIFTAVSMALYIPGGVLADRGSPKKLLLLSLIMMCGLNAYFAFHTSYGAAQLIWALLAIAANTVQWPTLIKAIRDTGSSEEQGRMFGTFYGTTGIFSSIIGFVGAWIYSNGSSNIEGFHSCSSGSPPSAPSPPSPSASSWKTRPRTTTMSPHRRRTPSRARLLS
ncbi:MAG: MFS transporter [Bilophila wadsworthia]